MRRDWIRRVYRAEVRGLPDDDLLMEVGWALWERAQDVAYVSTAINEGWVDCPNCGGRARRKRREGHRRGGSAPTPVVCDVCGTSRTWLDVQNALRHARPLCLDCGGELEWIYGENELHCPTCGTTIDARRYRKRLGQRKRLPCPHCGQPVRKPDQAHGVWKRADEVLSCPSCGADHAWKDVRAHWREVHARESGDSGASGRRLAERLRRRKRGPCPTCGETISRPPDSVACGRCGWEGTWESFRRTWQGEGLMTGAGVPACDDFIQRWPTARDGARQMLLVDGFLHALHFGPLAPLFVQGSRQSVAELLDEIGGIRRGAP